MTREQLKRAFPNISDDVLNASCDAGGVGLRPGDTQPTQGSALDGGVPGEKESRHRARIVFTVYSTRPADWDGYCIKQIQDCLRYAGLLAGDEWDILEGSIRSEKVHTKAEERTVIQIYDDPGTGDTAP